MATSGGLIPKNVWFSFQDISSTLRSLIVAHFEAEPIGFDWPRLPCLWAKQRVATSAKPSLLGSPWMPWHVPCPRQNDLSLVKRANPFLQVLAHHCQRSQVAHGKSGNGAIRKNVCICLICQMNSNDIMMYWQLSDNT